MAEEYQWNLTGFGSARASLHWLSVTFAALLASQCPAALAEEGDVVTLTAGAGVIRDSNLLRTPANEQSDTIRRLSAGVKADVPVSLQHVIFEANVDDYHYADFSQLNYQGGAAQGAWNWQLADVAKGRLGYRYQRFIADLGDLQTSIRDLITQRTPFFSLNYLLTPEWQIVGDVSHADTRHSEQTTFDNRLETGAVGINYLTGSNNSVGLLIRRSYANYPNQESIAVASGTVDQVDNSYHETETSAVAVWNPSGESRLSARAGYTSRKHVDLTGRDFGGATGEIIYHWVPTGKTYVDVTAYRKIASSDDFSASFILFRGFAITPVWMALPTITVRAHLIRELRDYDGDPGIVLGTTERRSDTFQSGQISVAYAPTRNTEISLSFERGKRDSNRDGFDYTYNQTGAAFRASF